MARILLFPSAPDSGNLPGNGAIDDLTFQPE